MMVYPEPAEGQSFVYETVYPELYRRSRTCTYCTRKIMGEEKFLGYPDALDNFKA